MDQLVNIIVLWLTVTFGLPEPPQPPEDPASLADPDGGYPIWS